MNSTSRVVRHLRLRAPTESAIHRAVVLFEDALRTASLPDDAGRIVLVRSLALGRIDGRAAPQVVAMRLESAFERVAPECVYAGSAGAPRASAVWFRDALDAHTRLALQLAAGAPVDAWYWKLAVSAWEPGTPLPHALRQIMFSLAALPEARTALPRWTADLTRAGHEERLVAALRPQDVVPLARAAALPAAAPAGIHPRSTAGLPRMRDEADTSLIKHSAADGPSADRWGPHAAVDAAASDPRRILLKALLAAAGAGAQNVRDRGMPPATGDAQTVHNPERSASDQAGSNGIPGSATDPARSDVDPSHGAGGQQDNVSTAEKTAFDAPVPGGAPPRRGVDSAVPDNDRAAVPSGVPWISQDSITRAGGLLFLIRVLERLGYPDWLKAQPEWAGCDVAGRVFASVLARLQIAPEDPAWALASGQSLIRSTPRSFVAPARWQTGLARTGGSMKAINSEGTRTLWDASGRLLLGAWTGRCPRALADAWRRAAQHPAGCPADARATLVVAAWVVALRSWLRRGPRIGLADLVLRPAIQSLTPTHADLEFEAGACDLRIRRPGLDFDPGWVPWYGRVITFHYR